MIEALVLNLSIVNTLKKYGSIPVDFLAKILRRRKSEILENLGILEKEGVITLTGENVSLSTKPDQRHS